jgi:hypothetical protein
MKINEQNVPLDDPLWLDLLVDDELTGSQRETLLAHVEQKNYWRQCALAFVNDQLIANSLTSSASHPSNPIDTANRFSPDVNPQARKSRYGLLTIAALMLGFATAWLWQSQAILHERQVAAQARAESESRIAAISEALTGIQSMQARLEHSTHQLNERTICLTKIIDNEFISVFDTPGTIPDLFLETLVMAGHDVNVSQHKNANSEFTQRITIRKSPRINTSL